MPYVHFPMLDVTTDGSPTTLNCGEEVAPNPVQSFIKYISGDRIPGKLNPTQTIEKFLRYSLNLLNLTFFNLSTVTIYLLFYRQVQNSQG